MFAKSGPTPAGFGNHIHPQMEPAEPGTKQQELSDAQGIPGPHSRILIQVSLPAEGRRQNIPALSSHLLPGRETETGDKQKHTDPQQCPQ